MAEWISLREFARRMGVSLTAVQKAVSSARIPVECVRRAPSGRLRAIEAEGAAEQWGQNTDPCRADRSAVHCTDSPAADRVGSAPDSYRQARAQREQSLAALAELELFQRRGELVLSRDVDRHVTGILQILKSNVFLIADRKAQILAAESDARKIHSILMSELASAFAEAAASCAHEVAPRQE